MVSVLSRPQSFKIASGQAATIEEDYTADATVVKTNHSLPNNSWVFIKSRVEDYNGFWKILVMNANRFQLQNGHGDLLSYVVDADITYFAQLGTEFYNWSAVFNPIVYRLKNNLWPNNSGDTIRLVTGFDNSNGSVRITTNASIGGGAQDYDFIQIANTVDMDGVYQITDLQTGSLFVIDLAYSSSYSFLNATVQIYHRNYNIMVRVSSGFLPAADWYPVKPIAPIATFRLIPDQNNEVMLSVHELLQASINQRNGTLLATLPNNTDFWTSFYIEYAESYDSGQNGEVVQIDQAFTSDESTFVGYAANAKMPFKNRYSGFMTEYLDKFLTIFDTPVMFAGCADIDDCYFDLSFFGGEFANQVAKQQWYKNGILLSTTGKAIGSSGAGIYRFQPDQNCDYDRVDITVVNSFLQTEELDQWVNENTGPGPSWAPGATPNVTIPAIITTTTDEIGTIAVAYSAGAYTFSYSLFVNNANTSVRIIIHVKGYKSGVSVGDGSTTRTITTPTELIEDAPISVSFSDIPDKVSVYIFLDAVSGGGSTYAELRAFSSSEASITETKTVTVDCGCSDGLRMSWLNSLGGFEHWTFKAFKDNLIAISETGETSVNTFPAWPNSYGEFADTDKRRQTFRDSQKQFLIRSQNLTRAQADALATIKSSPLVQIITSVYDKRTVIVDPESFTLYNDNDKLYSISFTITYTDDIASQTV